ncbi:TolC family protein [Pedobacter aquatilis]|uniref:TolC family protein n=1 Tax=Pedobacter aquatilis TaxID=351343 RepID=UPI0025B33D53|nr:TolC family protein [Pedobacter aquatilis]MDN3586147.1 TolC family protein [Pedobacter aquatilis]
MKLNIKIIIPFFIMSCLIAFITSCSSVRQANLPELKKLPDSFSRLSSAPAEALSWKAVFTQPDLRSLIDTTLKNNLSIQSGVQRVLVAGLNLRLSRSKLYPSLSAGISAGIDHYGDYTMNGVGNYDTNFSDNLNDKQRIPSPTPDYFAGFRSSWEIDIWGKLSEKKRAAYNRYLSSQAGLQWYKTQIISQVAELYYELTALDKRLEILQRNILLQNKGLEIVEAQMAGGRATALAVSQFKAQRMATQGRQFEIRQAINRIENELNMLMGRYRGKPGRDTSAITKVLPREVYAGIPAKVILSRPDVREAELQLAASKADVNAARKAFLPTLTLDAYAGYNSFKLPLLFSPASMAAGFLGGLSAPLLNRAALKNSSEVANSAQLSAFYNYQGRIIKAYQEVSVQLSAIENYKQAYRFKSNEVEELKKAVSTANDLYLSGYASYLEVIVAQRSVLDAEMQQVDLKQKSYSSLINLFRALGG